MHVLVEAFVFVKLSQSFLPFVSVLKRCRVCSPICQPTMRVDIVLLHLSAVLLELPVAVVERADLTCLEPSGDAVEVESVL
jgi:hypothetical protein